MSVLMMPARMSCQKGGGREGDREIGRQGGKEERRGGREGRRDQGGMEMEQVATMSLKSI